MKKLFAKRSIGILSCLLAVLIVISFVPTSGFAYRLNDTTVLEDVDFDESNIVLNLGVMSDLHLSYSYDSLASIQTKIANYAKASFVLDELSGGLDAILLCGDYTSTGQEFQVRTFLSASKAIMNAVNVGKSEAEKTAWIMTYGNHDTEWGNNLTVSQWETLMNEYGLLDDVTMGPDGAGCYKLTINKNGKTYYVFSLETTEYNAPSNMFRVDTLEWLDDELAAVSADDYVYVVSHGPIKESGAYGADINFDKNADWGTAESGYTGTNRETGKPTSSEIDALLTKYPNVVYFSGHTHFTDFLESSIMQKNYTAVNVGALHAADLYSSLSKFLDEEGGNKGSYTRDGYSLLLQVDGNGNLRIKRIKNAHNYANVSISYSQTWDKTLANTSTASGEPELVSAAYVQSVTVNSVSMPAAADIDDGWTMPAPKADKSHLKYFSQERACAPVFADNATVSVSNALIADGKFTASVTFNTATCSTLIHRYEISVYNSEGTLLGSRWALGNWTNSTSGILNSGENHLNATALKYTVSFDTTVLADSVTVKVVAVDEFGGRSSAITSAAAECLTKLSEPVYTDSVTNYFDNIIAESVPSRVTKDGTTYSWNNINQSNPWDKVHYFFDAARYDFLPQSKDGWSTPYLYPEYFTPFDVNDTFVYEADFSATEQNDGYFNFAVRMDTSVKNNNNLYTGVRVANGRVYLFINGGDAVATSTAAGLKTDGSTHHITIVSEPERISVWIDGIAIFQRVPYTKNADMMPTMYVWGQQIKGTVSNQKLYYYNKLTPGYDRQEDEDFGALTKNYLDGAKLVYTCNPANGITVPTATLRKVTTTVKDTVNAYGAQTMFYVLGGNNQALVTSPNLAQAAQMSSFSATDEVVWEFDYNADSFYSNGNRTYAQFYATLRSNGTQHVELLVRSNGQFGLFVAGQDVNIKITNNWNFLKQGRTHRMKIVSTNTNLSLWVDGILVYDNLSYTALLAAKSSTAVLNTDTLVPVFGFTNLQGADFTFDRVKVYKKNVTVNNYSNPTDKTNLMNTSAAQPVSSVGAQYTGFKWDGAQLYNNTYCTNLNANGYSNYYVGDTIYFFGRSNTNYTFNKGGSYALSMIVKSNNTSSSPVYGGEYTYASRLSWFLGTYNGESVWCFYQDGTLFYYDGVNVTHGQKTVGIGAGEYFTYTAVVTPYGYHIYIDGMLAGGWEFPDPTKFNVNPYFQNNGNEMIAQEIAVWSVDSRSESVSYIESLKADVEAMKAKKGVKTTNLIKVNTALSDATDILSSYANAGNVTAEQLDAVIDELEEAKDSFDVYNNFIYGGSSLTGESKSYTLYTNDDSAWKYGSVALFENGGCPAKAGEVFVVEADVEVTRSWSNPRIGFSLTDTPDGDVMIQHNTQYVNTAASSWSASYATTVGTKPNIRNGLKAHLKFTVTPNVGITYLMTSLDGNTVYHEYTAPWSALRSSVTGATTLSPRFYFACVDVKLTNIYAGYDLDHYADALDDTIAEYDALAANYITSSATELKTALAEAKRIKADYSECSKATIVNAGSAVTTAYTALTQKNNVTVSVGGDDNESFSLTVGDSLPTNSYFGMKYIIGWVDESGNAYTGNVSADKQLTADYIQLGMMDVKYQITGGATASSESLDCRFLASVDSTERYSSVGWLFSLTNQNPTRSDVGNSVAERTSTRVYLKVNANGTSLSTADVYAKDYSNYFYAFEIKNIPQSHYSSPIYVRAYVTLEDGTVVYGNTKAVVINDIFN